ncbi:hypothetical protein GUJ93_ZPchr0012g21709 [Zizania palustris]|uniref:Bifunctional inhibitor/plant lipid transfer protein/seed storage helical domain-containing protein n=1 Tax=Zizania palustris TaxID=103762 RepID=A0A8J6BV94_ZIZPA|nr:hypothetical protein GUJ93_ZPchr0012g21709 [Zizania palustris]
MARAQVVIPTPCCSMFQGLDLVPCLQQAGAGAAGRAGGNISGACCSSLNQALDAGRRCLCSVLLSGGGVRVLAGLAAAIPALPLALPLPGCLLYAAPLAACQVTVPEQANAPPAAAADASTASATTVDSPPPQAAVVTPPSKRKRSDSGGMNMSNGDDSGAKEDRVSRSDACRRPKVAMEIRTSVLTVVVAIAVCWFNQMVSS